MFAMTSFAEKMYEARKLTLPPLCLEIIFKQMEFATSAKHHQATHQRTMAPSEWTDHHQA
ncbi:hypothetical protein Pla22_42180 [Rubripirellula amarantea]|uniref:Uncharacterized protein n=1 Tax=Rubripirellula amarantea TaxID=2527999 RepID=A0A5C5WL83_9BACT|nr:hypothetical protein Pla22_42180 [Rubripirellula amarantea]